MTPPIRAAAVAPQTQCPFHEGTASGGGAAIVSSLRGRDEVAAGFGLRMLVWTDGGDAA